jgi:hypothetical protein
MGGRRRALWPLDCHLSNGSLTSRSRTLQAQVNTKQNFAFVWGTITTAKPRSHIFSEIKIRELGTATLPKPKRCANTGEFIMRNITADSNLELELLPPQLLIVGGIMICVLLGTIAFIE